MNKLNTISIREYLTRKGIAFREANGEIISKCIFSSCDDDSRANEAHLYFSSETGQYDCKKCGVRGNIITLARHLGDNIEDIALHPRNITPKHTKTKFSKELVESCHLALPDHIRQYLNARGIVDDIIDKHKLGWGVFYNRQWITIPIIDAYGNFSFFKLRQDPNDGNNKIIKIAHKFFIPIPPILFPFSTNTISNGCRSIFRSSVYFSAIFLRL